MRYLICKNNVSKEEMVARMKYIHDVFHVYTLKSNKNSNEKIVALSSIPKNQPDVLMLVGHDPITNDYIIQNINKIPEKNIIVLSCNTSKIRGLRKNIKDKNIYLPKDSGEINFFNGKEVKFEFDVTDEEIILYRNRKENLEEMILKAFERVELNGEDN